LQAGLAGALFFSFPIFQWLSIIGIAILNKIGIFIRLQRQVAVMDKPLPIDPKLSF